MNGDLPAYPQDHEGFACMGLTKRELFAAMAMQGLLSDHETSGPLRDFARIAVSAADALIAELEKGRTETYEFAGSKRETRY